VTAEIERPGRVVVVSPHLDDASLSIGAAIAGCARSQASARFKNGK